MEEKINLDEHLDYRKLFTAIVEKPTVSGDSLTGCCPIHKDSNPSFRSTSRPDSASASPAAGRATMCHCMHSCTV